MAKLFQHHHTATTGNDKAVARRVIGPAGGFGGIVIFAAHRAHGVEQAGQRPVQLFAAAGKDDVLLAHLDQLGAIADAMRRGGAGRGDGIVHALDFERRRQTGRVGGRHALGHAERADPFGTAGFIHNRVRAVEGLGRRPARPHDKPGPFARNLIGCQPGIGDGIAHGDKVIGRAIAHEPQVALVDMVFQHNVRLALYPAAKAVFGVVFGKHDPRFARPQAGLHFGKRISDGRDDPDPGDDDAAHGASS